MDEKLTETDIQKFKYGVIAYSFNLYDIDLIDIVHFVGFEHPITQQDLDNVFQELNTDEEFGLVGKMGNSIFLSPAPQDVIDYYINSLLTQS
jgi:hypothetical protein